MDKEKRFDSVTEMVEDCSDSKEFVESFKERIIRTKLIKNLIAIRTAKRFSRVDLAVYWRCNVSHIIKIENSEDDDILVGDLRKYANIMDMDIEINFLPRKNHDR